MGCDDPSLMVPKGHRVVGYTHGVTDYVPIDEEVDMVNHPPHYGRGPTVECPHCGRSRVIECIEVIRWIKDMRLATAMKYIWRVAFGGKDNDREDIEKSRWYTQDWLNNEVK